MAIKKTLANYSDLAELYQQELLKLFKNQEEDSAVQKEVVVSLQWEEIIFSKNVVNKNVKRRHSQKKPQHMKKNNES